jgi:hypothetical protein
MRLVQISNCNGIWGKLFSLGVFMSQQQICVCRRRISESGGFRRIVKTRLGNMCIPSRFAFSHLSLNSKTIILPSRNVGGGEWGENWKYNEVRNSLHSFLIFLIFLQVTDVFWLGSEVRKLHRPSRIAPPQSQRPVAVCPGWRRSHLSLDIQRVACGVKRLLCHAVYNNGYFKGAFFPSQEQDLSVFVLTYLLYVVHFAISSEW